MLSHFFFGFSVFRFNAQLLPDDEIWSTRFENRNRGQNRRLKSHHKSRHKYRHNDQISFRQISNTKRDLIIVRFVTRFACTCTNLVTKYLVIIGCYTWVATREAPARGGESPLHSVEESSTQLLILFGLVWRRALYRYSGVEPPCAINYEAETEKGK
jgi:hypothetical protein